MAREAALAVAKSSSAADRAVAATGSTVAFQSLPGWRARTPASSIAATWVRARALAGLGTSRSGSSGWAE